MAARVSSATHPNAALDILELAVEALGAESGFLISFVRDSADMAACRFMVACNPSWCQQYLQYDALLHDPWLQYAAANSEPVVASALPCGSTQSQQVVDIARRNGFASAALFPAHAGAGISRISLMVLGSSRPDYFESGGFERLRIGARTIAAEFHDWWLRGIRQQFLVRSRFTTEDLELLRLHHQGHSSKRMAIDLGVSCQSINSRFQRMSQRLGVVNRRAALKLAFECGLIE